jgi:hypothetical protein
MSLRPEVTNSRRLPCVAVAARVTLSFFTFQRESWSIANPAMCWFTDPIGVLARIFAAWIPVA